MWLVPRDHMPSDWTLGRAAEIHSGVEQALMDAVPGLRATIQLLPSDVEAHFDYLPGVANINHSKGTP